MCKEDQSKLLLHLDDLEHMELGSLDALCAQSPGTPSAADEGDQSSAPTSLSSAASGGDDLASGGDDLASGSNNNAIFFARVPPLVPYEELFALFSTFGTVTDLNLFRRWQTAKTSKGCGTVRFSKPEQASAALLALNGVHTFDNFPSSEGPMVVEWMDASRLTSAEAAAALKAQQRDAKAAAADGKHYRKPRAKGASNSNHSNSNNSNSAGANNSAPLPNWAYLHQLNALALAQQNRSLAAAYGMLQQGSGLVGGPHPAAELLDPCSLMGGPLGSPEACCNSLGGGLGDPTSWGAVIQVHLLPIMSQACPATTMGPSNLASLSPLLPSAAAAAAVSRMNSHPLMKAPAAAAAAAAAAPSPSSNGLADQFADAVAGGFGCPTPSIEPWFSGGLTCHSEASLCSPALPSFAGASSASLLQSALLSGEQQQQRPSPLLVLEDAWASQSGNVLSPAAVNVPSSQHAGSGTYALFDSMSLLSSLNEAATAAVDSMHSSSILSGGNAGAAVGWNSACTLGANSANAAAAGQSSSSLGDPRATAGNSQDVLGFLPGRLGSVLPGQVDSFPPQERRSGDQQQKGPVAVHIPLSDASAGQLVAHMPHIAKMTGADVGMDTLHPHGVCLRLHGSRAAVKAASNLVHLLSPWSNV